MSLRIVQSLQSIPEAQWDALHDGSNPFVAHAFLAGLETHGCLKPHWGWQPGHACLFENDQLIAAAPAYAKSNSHGEFVFDHAWAHAYARYGASYYPKWLVAVPYSPVTGPRLLARNPANRATLAEALVQQTSDRDLSSVHVNFIDPAELDAFDRRWITRSDVQFQWRNRGGWTTFEEFLAALTAKKRKNLRAEREQVRRAGIDLRVVHGDEATPDELQAMHAFYCMTQTEKGNQPALTLPFLQHLASAMPRQLVLILASREGQTIAGALCLRGRDTLYGRYWGGSETVPGLHFETCYYQGIEYCLKEGLHAFEPGAQGEHKIARGFLPELTHSRHFITDPSFAQAIGEWCDAERESVLRYRELVLQHSPFREPIADHIPGR